MASPERPSRHGNAVADGPPRPFNSLAATNHLRSCAPRSRVEGWRGQGTKSVALRLVCVWRDRGGKNTGRPVAPSPPRLAPASGPSVVLSGYQPRRPNRTYLTLLIRSFTTGLVCRRVVSRSRTRTMPRTGTRRGRAATTSTNRTVDYETPRGPPSRRIDVNHSSPPRPRPDWSAARPGEPGRNAEESNLVSAARPLCVPVPCRVYERAGSGCRAAARTGCRTGHSRPARPRDPRVTATL